MNLGFIGELASKGNEEYFAKYIAFEKVNATKEVLGIYFRINELLLEKNDEKSNLRLEELRVAKSKVDKEIDNLNSSPSDELNAALTRRDSIVNSINRIVNKNDKKIEKHIKLLNNELENCSERMSDIFKNGTLDLFTYDEQMQYEEGLKELLPNDKLRNAYTCYVFDSLKRETCFIDDLNSFLRNYVAKANKGNNYSVPGMDMKNLQIRLFTDIFDVNQTEFKYFSIVELGKDDTSKEETMGITLNKYRETFKELGGFVSSLGSYPEENIIDEYNKLYAYCSDAKQEKMEVEEADENRFFNKIRKIFGGQAKSSPVLFVHDLVINTFDKVDKTIRSISPIKKAKRGRLRKFS